MPMKGIMDYSYISISLGQWCINCNYNRCTSESITFSFVENVMGGGGKVDDFQEVVHNKSAGCVTNSTTDSSNCYRRMVWWILGSQGIDNQ